ncbi:HlyD family secretion protein [Anaeromyxobacter terrae]|uniref:HlyD family secretion protein n=1 Tax=Anaeromyxobacter terrae TaxID=2925406 RepID=UPI001F58A8D6|nr:HlyD family secretion protein [Anaeromyxobacter sp. SG22]
MTPTDPKLHEVRPLPAAPPPAPAPARSRRRLIMGGGAALALLLLGAFAAWEYLHRGEEVTDDAQVEADVVAVAARVGGPIAEVLVEENAPVKAGQPILRLDTADYELRVRQAEAEVATARAQARAADAQIGAARATVTRAEAEAEKALADLRRADELKKGEAIAASQYDTTRVSSETARAGAGANRAQYAAALANAELAHARVQSAEAALALAKLQLGYTEVRAPADGAVTRLGARVGQIVAPGQVLGQLVPDRTYVVANFKETQTGAIRPGQRVDVEIDAYSGRTIEGRVESVSGGTGARFALLPPDNASGNFVKVVERVPVRIAWVGPPPDLSLRAGLSALVTVHTR